MPNSVLIRRFSRLALAAVALVAAHAASPRAAIAEPAPVIMERDGVKVTIAPPRWITIEVDGAPFSTHNTFYVVKPNWAVRYFGYEDDAKLPEKLERQGEHKLVIPMKAKHGEFEGRQVVELLPGRVLRVSVDAELTTDVEANMEMCFGQVEPGWVAGRKVVVTDRKGAKRNTMVPAAARLLPQKEATVARGFSALEFDSRLGPLTVKTEGSSNFQLLDYRRNEWNDERSQVWLGLADHRPEPNKPEKFSIELRFPPKAAQAAKGEAPAVTVEPAQAAEAVRLEPPRDLIIPTPKQVKWLKDDLALPASPTVSISGEGLDPDFAAQLVGTVIEDAARQHGLALAKGEPGSAAIEFRLAGKATTRPEEYTVKVGGTAVLEAATTEGLVNAAATLRQLFRERDGRRFVRGVELRDWPAMPFRGIHFFTGRDGRDLHVKMLQEVLGALKLNALVYQCEYIMWDSHPEIHHKQYGMPKADAAAVVAEAAKRHIETIPLINTFGHSEWLIDNDVYRHLAEDPETPYAYDPSTSEPIRICEEIYDEAIELFKPRYFHIGKDEIMAPGFPKREVNRAVGAQRLILNDIAHYHQFLAKRGIRAMMWGDMFLHGDEAPDATNANSLEEAKALRAELPKDIIITDWHYAPAEVKAYRSLEIFNREGFDTIASPWSSPTNILRFAKAAVKAADAAERRGGGGRSMGTLQTTWAGYSFGHYSFWEAPNQYGAYVLAAEAAWVGGGESPDDVPFNFREEFDRIWYGKRLPREAMAGWVCDLSAVANFDMKPTGDTWLGYKVEKGGAVSVPEGEFVGRFRTRREGATGPLRGVLLSAALNPGTGHPTSLKADIGTTASAVYTVTAATFPGQPYIPVGTLRFRFDDDTELTQSLELGERVFAFDDARVRPESPIVWRAPAERGLPQRTLHAYVWRNPQPAKVIRSIEVESANRASGVVVFAMGGVQAGLPELNLYTEAPKP